VIRRIGYWIAGIVLTAAVALTLAAFWLVGTESGARWLAVRAQPWLPEPLQLGTVQGTLVGGLEFSAPAWEEDLLHITADHIAAHVELLPLLRREVRLSRVVIRRPVVVVDKAPPTDEPSTPFSLDLPIALVFEDASVADAQVVVHGDEWLIEQLYLVARLAGTALEVDRLDVRNDLADVSLKGRGRLAGKFPASVEASWAVNLPDQPAARGSLKIEGDTTTYMLSSQLVLPYEVDTEGTISFAEGTPLLDLVNSWQSIAAGSGDSGDVAFNDGVLRIVGTLDEFDFDGGAVVIVPEIPELAVRLHGRRTDDILDVEQLDAASDWGLLSARGRFDIALLSWDFRYDLREVDVSRFNESLRGTMQSAGTVTGRVAAGNPVVNVLAESLEGQFMDLPVAGSATVAYENDVLRVSDGVVTVGANRADVDASFGQQQIIDAVLAFPDLGQFGQDVTGSLAGDVHLVITQGKYAGHGRLSGERLQRGAFAADELALRFDLPAAGPGDAALSIDAGDRGKFQLEIDGQFVDEAWVGNIRDLAIRSPVLDEWLLRDPVSFTVSRSRVDIANACLLPAGATGIACVKLDYDYAGVMDFDVSVSQFPLAALPIDPPVGSQVTGMLVASANGALTEDGLNAVGRALAVGIGLDATYEGEEVSVRFDRALVEAVVVNNRLTATSDFRLEDSSDHITGAIEIDNVFDPGSAMNGRGRLELNDFSLFSFFFPDVANPRGTIVGNLEANGSLLDPDISGEVSLAGGSFDIRRAGISITDAELVLRQQEAGNLTLKGAATSGEGRLDISGNTTFSMAGGVRTGIRIVGEDFRLIQLPDWQITTSPAIDIVFDERMTRVTGDLGIPAADIKVHTVPEATVKPSGDVVVHRGEVAEPKRQREIIVDVTTSLGDEVYFSGFGLSTGLTGSVRISGGTRSPYTSSGRLVLRDGRYTAYGQSLEIESGELVFNGPLTNPSFNVRATRTAGDNTVAGIHLTGTPAQLKSDVYSEPPSTDAEALSYLLTGRPLGSASTAEGDMLNQAAFALGLSAAGGVAAQIRNELGLETLGVQGSGENQRVYAGVRLGSRLFVEYAYGLFDNLGSLLLRYQLSNRLIVESRSGAVRTVDVVYSVKGE